MKRLHPRHSAEWLSYQAQNTGCYPDTERDTGRTTALALTAIRDALATPHTRIALRDHRETPAADLALAGVVRRMLHCLALEGMSFVGPNRGNHSVGSVFLIYGDSK